MGVFPVALITRFHMNALKNSVGQEILALYANLKIKEEKIVVAIFVKSVLGTR